MPKCKFCNSEIVWLKEGRKFKALETDGNLHECEERKTSMGSLKSIQPSTLSAEEIAKYEEAINKTPPAKKKKPTY